MKRNFAKVVVHVEDCNDHAPTFLTPRYEANVSRQVPAGSPVVRVKALDRDVGSNAEIRYSIVSGEHQRSSPRRRSSQMKADAFTDTAEIPSRSKSLCFGLLLTSRVTPSSTVILSKTRNI